MKKLALGIATAVLLATAAVPAMAQVGFYAGPGGVGVDVGAPPLKCGHNLKTRSITIVERRSLLSFWRRDLPKLVCGDMWASRG